MTGALRKHTSAIVLLLVLSGVVFASVVTPGRATEYPGDCPEGHVCLYEHANWQGEKIFDQAATEPGIAWNIPRDRASSWANRTWGVWVAFNLRGWFRQYWWPLWVMGPRTSNRNVGAGANDKADLVWRANPVGY
jgi:hypothetical protein